MATISTRTIDALLSSERFESTIAEVEDDLLRSFVRDELERIKADLDRPEAVVVFGGHYSSGKSTLINALLGRYLLPSSGFPETGVPCWLRAGEMDAAVVVTSEGSSPIAVDEGAIAREVSLMGDDMSYREHIADVVRVDVELGGAETQPAGRRRLGRQPGYQ